jgi:hypothetical protein
MDAAAAQQTQQTGRAHGSWVTALLQTSNAPRACDRAIQVVRVDDTRGHRLILQKRHGPNSSLAPLGHPKCAPHARRTPFPHPRSTWRKRSSGRLEAGSCEGPSGWRPGGCSGESIGEWRGAWVPAAGAKVWAVQEWAGGAQAARGLLSWHAGFTVLARSGALPVIVVLVVIVAIPRRPRQGRRRAGRAWRAIAGRLWQGGAGLGGEGLGGCGEGGTGGKGLGGSGERGAGLGSDGGEREGSRGLGGKGGGREGRTINSDCTQRLCGREWTEQRRRHRAHSVVASVGPQVLGRQPRSWNKADCEAHEMAFGLGQLASECASVATAVAQADAVYPLATARAAQSPACCNGDGLKPA